MRFENDGMVLWYGTPDASAPLDSVRLAAGSHQAIAVTIAVQPASASNSVVVRFTVNGGTPQTVTAAFLQHNVHERAQYFVATFPELHVNDKVDYIPICRCPGRQVPDRGQASTFPSSFRVISADPAPNPGIVTSAPRVSGAAV